MGCMHGDTRQSAERLLYLQPRLQTVSRAISFRLRSGLFDGFKLEQLPQEPRP